MAAYKVGAEGGHAGCQHQVGIVYYEGPHGIAVDYKQARLWLEKAAAQDHPGAVCQLGAMYGNGEGVTPSWRRAGELYKRAGELGEHTQSVKEIQTLTEHIQKVS